MAEEKRLVGRGGPGRGQGRKQLASVSEQDPLIERTVTLPQSVINRLLAIDTSGRYEGGNLSLGVLEALCRLDERKSRK